MHKLIIAILFFSLESRAGTQECKKWKSVLIESSNKISMYGDGGINLDMKYLTEAPIVTDKVSLMSLSESINIPVIGPNANLFRKKEWNTNEVFLENPFFKYSISHESVNPYEVNLIPDELSFISYSNNQFLDLSRKDYLKNKFGFGLGEIDCDDSGYWKKHILPFIDKLVEANTNYDMYFVDKGNYAVLFTVNGKRDYTFQIIVETQALPHIPAKMYTFSSKRLFSNRIYLQKIMIRDLPANSYEKLRIGALTLSFNRISGRIRAKSYGLRLSKHP